MSSKNPPAREEVKKTIPLSAALSILVLTVSLVTFAYDLRSDLDEAGEDRFKGMDMDRFIERLQVTLDGHMRDVQGEPIRLRGWRPRE